MAKNDKEALKALGVNELKLREVVRNVWTVFLTGEETIQDVLRPEFWKHVSGSLKRFDKVEVIFVTKEAYAELLVLSVKELAARVIVTSAVGIEIPKQVALTGSGKDLSNKIECPKGYKVVYGRGAQQKWMVIRLSDGEELTRGIDTEAEALLWAQQHSFEINR